MGERYDVKKKKKTDTVEADSKKLKLDCVRHKCIMIHERQVTCKQNQEEENKAAIEMVHGYFNEGRKGILYYQE